MTSAFIIDIQSELGPDYEQMNNVLLEMLFNATTGTLPAGSAVSIPRWSGPNPVIVQVQCVFYATLSATLLAAFLAMLGKQWLAQYKRNETRGSIADRSRVRERKFIGLRAWRFHTVMESLPLILQFALALLGSALSRYLWEVNHSVSSVVIGFTCFGFLFYSFVVTASVLSFYCPFQTPFSLLIRSAIALAATRWKKHRKTLGPTQCPPQPESQPKPPSPTDTASQGHEPGANVTIQFPTPLFVQDKDLESDRLDARCVDLLFEMSTDSDVVTSIMDFILEITWHSGIKNVPLKRIYDILICCFDFSGPHPVLIPKSRDLAYLSAKAFVHIELQRRCITKYEEQDSWKHLCTNHHPLSLPGYPGDTDLKTVLFMVDMTLGHCDNVTWENSVYWMTETHRAWMSHVFLYYAWHMGQVSDVVAGFVQDSLTMTPPNTVITDCFIIIGLMIGVPVHVSDLIVKDKRLDINSSSMSLIDLPLSSCEKMSIIQKVFHAFTAIFSSESTQMSSASHALLLATRLSNWNNCAVSYELFKAIMAPDHLSDEQWEAARLAIHGAFNNWLGEVGEPKEVLKFLDYHVALQGAGGDYEQAIKDAVQGVFLPNRERIDPMTLECVRDFNWTSPSFVKGIRSMMQPHNCPYLREHIHGLVALVSDRWFNCSVHVMEPEEMPEFCEHIAMSLDDSDHTQEVEKEAVTILFGMLRSPEWRKHIVPRSWSVLAYCPLVKGLESAKWCLQNAVELLNFMEGLPEGSKWWYWTLWFHYDQLDAATRRVVKTRAKDMVRNNSLSDLNLYLSLIQKEIKRIEEDMDGLYEEEEVRHAEVRSIALEGNYERLDRIVRG